MAATSSRGGPAGRAGTVVGRSRAERFRDAERRIGFVSRIMDDLVPIPGTSQRIGLDPVLGLVPGAGDLVSAIAGGWIIVEAVRFGIPGVVLLRMAWNTVVDLVVGAIPLLGDLFDVAFRSNRRNLELFRRHALDPAASTAEHWTFVAGLAVIAVGLLWLVWSAVAWLLSIEIPAP
jgi:Domain of unknown function (DUF4112)